MSQLVRDLARIKDNLKEASRYVLSQPGYVKAHMDAAVGDLEGVIRRAGVESRNGVTILDAIEELRAAGGDAWDEIDDPARFLGRD